MRWPVFICGFFLFVPSALGDGTLTIEGSTQRPSAEQVPVDVLKNAPLDDDPLWTSFPDDPYEWLQKPEELIDVGEEGIPILIRGQKALPQQAW